MDIPRATPATDFSEIKKAIEAFEEETPEKIIEFPQVLFPFDPNTISEEALDSLGLPGNIKRNIVRYRQSGGKFYQPSALRKIYGMDDSLFMAIEPFIVIGETSPPKNEIPVQALQPDTVRFFFDPNTATADDLLLLGFKRFQAINIGKYREKGGKFSEPSDLYKIYGIDTALISQLLPWIKIPEETIIEKKEYVKIQQLVELNTADSASLVGIRGIGPAFASRIIKYRNRLGGFRTKEQLLEVYGLNNEIFQSISSQVWADSTKIVKIRLNFADFQTLLKHPYFSKQDVGNIIKYRGRHGPFKAIDELQEKNIVESQTFNKVKFYLEPN